MVAKACHSLSTIRQPFHTKHTGTNYIEGGGEGGRDVIQTHNTFSGDRVARYYNLELGLPS